MNIQFSIHRHPGKSRDPVSSLSAAAKARAKSLDPGLRRDDEQQQMRDIENCQ
jgi:hypothetical protein